MDVNMPKMDGLEALALINDMKVRGEISWPLEIIMLTAFFNEKDQQFSLSHGAKYYMAKPIGIKQISNMLSQLYQDMKCADIELEL